MLVFSLHATKLLSCGEGGLCIYGDNIPKYIRSLTNFGINKHRIQEWKNSTNAKMSEFNAAAGLASLDNLNNNCEKILKAKQLASFVLKENNINLFDENLEPTLTMNIDIDINDDLVSKLK